MPVITSEQRRTSKQPGRRRINWRWAAAAFFFLCALFGLMTGVTLTERPYVVNAGLLTKAYYSLGLFVVGGLDIGTPVGGPLLGRIMLWIALAIYDLPGISV